MTLTPDSYLRLLSSAPDAGIAGGQIYDAVIAQTALDAGVDVLLTFNERYFARHRSAAFAVVVPSA